MKPQVTYYVAVLVLIIAYSSESTANRVMRPPFAGQKRAPPVMCTPDSLMVYQDCRMCVCPRPNRAAKCFKKSCDLRTKDGGQCPAVVLKMDDSKLCPASPSAQCKVDADCPAQQLCCFDFCNGAKCVNPVPLDLSSGMPVHNGRGYQS